MSSFWLNFNRLLLALMNTMDASQFSPSFSQNSMIFSMRLHGLFIAKIRGHSPVPASPSSNHTRPRVKAVLPTSSICLSWEGNAENEIRWNRGRRPNQVDFSTFFKFIIATNMGGFSVHLISCWFTSWKMTKLINGGIRSNENSGNRLRLTSLFLHQIEWFKCQITPLNLLFHFGSRIFWFHWLYEEIRKSLACSSSSSLPLFLSIFLFSLFTHTYHYFQFRPRLLSLFLFSSPTQ